MMPITAVAPDLDGRTVLSQVWADLLFLHWRVDADEVAPLLPSGVRPDEFDGSSWIGLIPFEMRDTRVLGAVPVPYLGSFTEINVRLYGIDSAGRRGVVFASLEATRLAAVLAARASFSLPYCWARTRSRHDGHTLSYASVRHTRSAPGTRIVATRSTSRVADDPLAEFLTARWLLFQNRNGRTIAMPNQHDTWELFGAELVELEDGLLGAAGIRSLAGRAPDSIFYSPGVTTRFGAPTRIARASPEW